MVDSLTPSLSSLVQGFIYSLTAEGKSPATVYYYQGNLRRFLWYVDKNGWPLHTPVTRALKASASGRPMANAA